MGVEPLRTPLLHSFYNFSSYANPKLKVAFVGPPVTIEPFRMPRSSSTDDVAAEVRYALNAFPEIQEIFHIQQSVAGTRNYFRPRVVWRVVRKVDLQFWRAP